MFLEKQVEVIKAWFKFVKENLIVFLVMLLIVSFLFYSLIFPFFSVAFKSENIVKNSIWVTGIFTSTAFKIVYMILYAVFLSITIHVIREAKGGIKNIQIISFCIATLVLVCQYIYTQDNLKMFYGYFTENIFFAVGLLIIFVAVSFLLIRPKKKKISVELSEAEAEYIVDAVNRYPHILTDGNEFTDAVAFADSIKIKINKTLGEQSEIQNRG
jgi:hypothetical protein